MSKSGPKTLQSLPIANFSIAFSELNQIQRMKFHDDIARQVQLLLQKIEFVSDPVIKIELFDNLMKIVRLEPTEEQSKYQKGQGQPPSFKDLLDQALEPVRSQIVDTQALENELCRILSTLLYTYRLDKEMYGFGLAEFGDKSERPNLQSMDNAFLFLLNETVKEKILALMFAPKANQKGALPSMLAVKPASVPHSSSSVSPLSSSSSSSSFSSPSSFLSLSSASLSSSSSRSLSSSSSSSSTSSSSSSSSAQVQSLNGEEDNDSLFSLFLPRKMPHKKEEIPSSDNSDKISIRQLSAILNELKRTKLLNKGGNSLCSNVEQDDPLRQLPINGFISAYTAPKSGKAASSSILTGFNRKRLNRISAQKQEEKDIEEAIKLSLIDLSNSQGAQNQPDSEENQPTRKKRKKG